MDKGLTAELIFRRRTTVVLARKIRQAVRVALILYIYIFFWCFNWNKEVMTVAGYPH